MKRNNISILLSISILVLMSPLASSAHWIAGYVENALDSTSPNGRTARMWNPLNAQEIFGTVGPSGASGTSNVYMIDCELLATPCQAGDKLNITIVDDASGYLPKNTVQITVTGAGFDVAANISLNTPPNITSINIEDSLTSPLNEIDLTPATTTRATCSGIVEDYDGDASIQSIQAKLFSPTSSFDSEDDNNSHYTNSTCQINTSYGNAIQAAINCSFDIEYYANPGLWTCEFNTTDNYTASTTSSDTTLINTLLAIGVNSPMDFGEMDSGEVSTESTAEVTNYGNIKINLTLSGYGQTPLDGNAMECGANNISIEQMKFNLTASNTSNLTLSEFNAIYENLTSMPATKKFNLDSRQNDLLNEAKKNTYWRVYVPQEINDDCSGDIVFGATQG